MVLSVNEQTFDQEVLGSPIPVLVNFWAPWCGLCHLIQPILLEFEARYSDQIKIVGINADANFKLSNTYRLTTLPTLILIEGGKVRQRLDSFRGRDELQQAIEEIVVIYTERTAYARVSVGSIKSI